MSRTSKKRVIKKRKKSIKKIKKGGNPNNDARAIAQKKIREALAHNNVRNNMIRFGKNNKMVYREKLGTVMGSFTSIICKTRNFLIYNYRNNAPIYFYLSTGKSNSKSDSNYPDTFFPTSVKGMYCDKEDFNGYSLMNTLKDSRGIIPKCQPGLDLNFNQTTNSSRSSSKPGENVNTTIDRLAKLDWIQKLVDQYINKEGNKLIYENTSLSLFMSQSSMDAGTQSRFIIKLIRNAFLYKYCTIDEDENEIDFDWNQVTDEELKKQFYGYINLDSEKIKEELPYEPINFSEKKKKEGVTNQQLKQIIDNVIRCVNDNLFVLGLIKEAKLYIDGCDKIYLLINLEEDSDSLQYVGNIVKNDIKGYDISSSYKYEHYKYKLKLTNNGMGLSSYYQKPNSTDYYLLNLGMSDLLFAIPFLCKFCNWTDVQISSMIGGLWDITDDNKETYMTELSKKSKLSTLIYLINFENIKNFVQTHDFIDGEFKKRKTVLTDVDNSIKKKIRELKKP